MPFIAMFPSELRADNRQQIVNPIANIVVSGQQRHLSVEA
jgi:hypothetical protein